VIHILGSYPGAPLERHLRIVGGVFLCTHKSDAPPDTRAWLECFGAVDMGDTWILFKDLATRGDEVDCDECKAIAAAIGLTDG
jgi:hypothetical protein